MELYAIAGSQGSGKSTTLDYLSQAGIPSIKRKTSRSILSDWGVTLNEVNQNPELTTRFQDEILKRKIHDDSSHSHNPTMQDSLFTERTFSDLFVYALISLGNDNVYSDWIDQYYEKCVEANRVYTKVFYLKAGHFDVEHDGVRGSNRYYSRMVDQVLLDYTQQMMDTNKLVIIDTPSLSERGTIIQTHIHN